MKAILIFIAALISLNTYAQLPISIYETPTSDNPMDHFEHDDNFLYVVRQSSVDKIDAVNNTVIKLFDKPWGSSINAKANAIFSNGKSIIGQYTLDGYTQKYKYWAYNGASFDTLFTIVGTQISKWVVDGDLCYFLVNNKIYKSDFTQAGTTEIANFPASTILVDMEVFNH
ncbi:MAG: hypothetical protein PHS84_01145, partial [Paludibacter sp.]|nr:hypothetical protein [Paludibacter sp.]